MSDCIFCRIARKELPAKIVSESTGIFAFHDINPQAPLHILLIPKVHIPSVMEVQSTHQNIVQELIAAAQKIAQSEGVHKSGFRLVFNCGPDAGQAVDHLHLHLLGKRKLAWPPG